MCLNPAEKLICFPMKFRDITLFCSVFYLIALSRVQCGEGVAKSKDSLEILGDDKKFMYNFPYYPHDKVKASGKNVTSEFSDNLNVHKNDRGPWSISADHRKLNHEMLKAENFYENSYLAGDRKRKK